MIKIAIGLGENENIKLAIEKANKIKDLEIKSIYSEDELIKELKNEDIDGIVRGSLKSSKLINEIKKLNKNPINRATYIKEKSFSSNNHHNYNYEFLLLPVGIDEGTTINELFEIAISASKFVKKIGKIPKIAVLSGGRKGDFGRNKTIDRTLQQSELLTQKLEKYFSYEYNSKNVSQLKHSIKNYYIQIEKAIKEENNIIIAPDGITGNIIFRTLVLLNSWNSYGAIALGLQKTFIDTSRDQSVEGYLRAIKLAYALVKLNKNLDNEFEL
jgi:putative methanogen marker protein 4